MDTTHIHIPNGNGTNNISILIKKCHSKNNKHNNNGTNNNINNTRWIRTTQTMEDKEMTEKKKPTNEEMQKKLDEIVGFQRGNEPELVIDCIKAPNRSAMIWYQEGYCLCSRFYKCRYQSDGIVIIDGKEKAVCCKYGSP